METRRCRSPPLRLRCASIGPRIFLRGNRRLRFWLRLGDLPLQLGHGFFSVETSHQLRGIAYIVLASIGPRIFLRGNRPEVTAMRFQFPASIGPRIFLRGNLPLMRDRDAGDSPLQLGHGFFSVETGWTRIIFSGFIRRFNWATDFSPWKHRKARF